METRPRSKGSTGAPRPMSAPGPPKREAAKQAEKLTARQLNLQPSPRRLRTRAAAYEEESVPPTKQKKARNVNQDGQRPDTDPSHSHGKNKSPPQVRQPDQDGDDQDTDVSHSSGEEDPQRKSSPPVPKASRRGAPYFSPDPEDWEVVEDEGDKGNEDHHPDQDGSSDQNRSDAEDDDENDEEVEGNRGAEDLHNEHTAEDEEPTSQDRLRLRATKTLLARADELADLLRSQNPEGEDTQADSELELTWLQFQGLRTIYSDSESNTFIEWGPSSIKDPRTGKEEYPAWDIGRANLVIALYTIRQLWFGQDSSDHVVSKLRALDEFFPKLGDPFDNRENALKVALDIRTLLAVEVLQSTKLQQSRKPVQGASAVIAKIFCEPFEGKLNPDLLSNGPYRDVGEDQTAQELYSERVLELREAATPKKGARERLSLRESFPLEEYLEGAKNWLEELYDDTAERLKTQRPIDKRKRVATDGPSRQQSPPQSGPEFYHDANEVLDGDEGDPALESQPIVRLDDGLQQTLFHERSDLMALKQLSGTRGPNLPPSNQQQLLQRREQQERHQRIPIPSQGPKDYTVHSNAELLRAAPSSAPSGVPFTSDHEDEEDEEFQQDTRSHDPSKRSHIESSIQKATQAAEDVKRRRISQERQAQHASAPASDSASVSASVSSSAATIPAGPSSSLPAAPSSSRHTVPLRQVPREQPPPPPARSTHQDLRDEIRHLTQLSQQLGPTPPARDRSTQVRVPWTDADCETLKEAIRRTEAHWRRIEREFKYDFQHPRNDQAYRDKARNMKVDFLLGDVVLPPGFDKVALGAKEREKVARQGKNPYRKEADYDRDGNATNTELA